MTYRHSGHSRADPAKYRPEGELERWKLRDPLIIYKARLRELGISEGDLSAIEADVQRVVDEATEACKAAPFTSTEILFTDVYADGGWAWRN
jgi:pyruvate dehydrogenase E1 component alpha subunit